MPDRAHGHPGATGGLLGRDELAHLASNLLPHCFCDRFGDVGEGKTEAFERAQASLRRISATATGSLSIPTQASPSSRATTRVVPLPANGSSASPPAGQPSRR